VNVKQLNSKNTKNKEECVEDFIQELYCPLLSVPLLEASSLFLMVQSSAARTSRTKRNVSKTSSRNFAGASLLSAVPLLAALSLFLVSGAVIHSEHIKNKRDCIEDFIWEVCWCAASRCAPFGSFVIVPSQRYSHPQQKNIKNKEECVKDFIRELCWSLPSLPLLVASLLFLMMVQYGGGFLLSMTCLGHGQAVFFHP
jgi:hypothetical protein